MFLLYVAGLTQTPCLPQGIVFRESLVRLYISLTRLTGVHLAHSKAIFGLFLGYSQAMLGYFELFWVTLRRPQPSLIGAIAPFEKPWDCPPIGRARRTSCAIIGISPEECSYGTANELERLAGAGCAG